MIQIKDKSECCGCTACFNICPKGCISMQEDYEGFRYPAVDKATCIDCHLCEKVCPIITPQKAHQPLKIFGLKNINITVQKASTSGGVFFALAEYTIAKKGVVIGAIYDEDFQVVHQKTEALADCKKFHGAKYVESHLLNNLFKEIKTLLKQERYVLFTGTPCQVAGLKNFLRKDYPNLLTCDLVCSSVPSPKVFRDYLNFAQRKKEIQSINMRWKEKGWDKTSQQITYADGKTLIGKGDAKLWHTIAFTHLVSRPSCHKCRFSNFERPGDFSIGDFWGIEAAHPSFFDKNGVSLTMLNTEKGEKVFEAIKDNFQIQPTTQELCRQPRLTTPVKPNPLREQFWKEYDSSRFETLARKYWRYGTWNQLKFQIRQQLSKIYHAIIKTK